MVRQAIAHVEAHAKPLLSLCPLSQLLGEEDRNGNNYSGDTGGARCWRPQHCHRPLLTGRPSTNRRHVLPRPGPLLAGVLCQVWGGADTESVPSDTGGLRGECARLSSLLDAVTATMWGMYRPLLWESKGMFASNPVIPRCAVTRTKMDLVVCGV